MKPLSVRIRRACARWMFTARELRAHYVAEEYGFGGRQADAIGLWLEYDEIRGVYRKVDSAWGSFPYKVSKRVSERTVHHPAEVRIVEVKISRTDFLVGRRKGQLANIDNGLGAFADFCYLAVPHPNKVLREAELPAGWGLLKYSESVSVGKLSAHISVAVSPKRLTPAHPLTKDPANLARALAQSCMWRLYGWDKKTADELDAAEAVS